MARWLLLSSSVLVLGALAVIDPSRDSDAHALGGTCEATRECREGLRCIDRAGVIEGQCSSGCTATGSCQSEFGAQSICLGADLCARTCQHASDCPEGTHCNVYNWCERNPQ